MPILPKSNTDTPIDKLTNSDVLKLYQFNFIESAITSFLWQIQQNFRKYKEDFPVYIFNGGDEAFLLDMQHTIGGGKTFKTSEIYQVKPRFEITIDQMTIQGDQLTMSDIEGLFTIPINRRDVTFHSPVTRIPLTVPIKGQLVCDSMLHAFMYSELILTMMFQLGTFEFWHAKRRHEGVYQMEQQLDQEKNMELSFDANTRDWKLNVTVPLQLQFPSFDFFNPSNNTIKPTTVGVMKEIHQNTSSIGDGTEEPNEDNTEHQIIDESDLSSETSDDLVGNVQNPQPMPNQNPDGSIKSDNDKTHDGSAADSSSNGTGWKSHDDNKDLTSKTMDVADTPTIGLKTHYPM